MQAVNQPGDQQVEVVFGLDVEEVPQQAGDALAGVGVGRASIALPQKKLSGARRDDAPSAAPKPSAPCGRGPRRSRLGPPASGAPRAQGYPPASMAMSDCQVARAPDHWPVTPK
jgi:hypothetical protein